jgi:hypothetical protein
VLAQQLQEPVTESSQCFVDSNNSNNNHNNIVCISAVCSENQGSFVRPDVGYPDKIFMK